MKEVHRIEFLAGNPRRLPLYEEIHRLFKDYLDEELLGAIPYQMVPLKSYRGEPRLVTGHLFQAEPQSKSHHLVNVMRRDFQARPATIAEAMELILQGGCPADVLITALGSIYLTESGACVPTVSVRKDGRLELILDQVEGVPWSEDHRFFGVSLIEAEVAAVPRNTH